MINRDELESLYDATLEFGYAVFCAAILGWAVSIILILSALSYGIYWLTQHVNIFFFILIR